MFHIIIDHKIHFTPPPNAKKLHPQFFSQLKKDMVLPNPAYEEAVKYGRFTRGIARSIVLWEYDMKSGVLSLPRGYLCSLIRLLKVSGIEYAISDARISLEPVPFRSEITLRDYQAPAVEALLKATQGILQAPAGSGKTSVGLEVIARIGQPALWLTHTKDLAQQAADRANEFLGIPKGEIGMLGAGCESIGRKLTIGIIQKLVRMDLSGIAGKFGCVVADEIHHCPAETWSKLMNRIPAKYRYGVTATFKRDDGLEVITERVIGPTLYIIDRAQVAAGVVTPLLKVVKTGVESTVWARYQQTVKRFKEHKLKPPTMPFGEILNEILNNHDRNNLITQTLLSQCPGHCSLVLSERVQHCELLKEELAKKCPGLKTEVIHGKLGKRVRKSILEAMNAGELDILFAVDIAKEGLDIPRLDRLFLVAGGRNEAETEQKVGRIQRPFPGKADAVIFDFVDERIGVLQAQHYVRRRVYKKLGIRVGREVRSA